MDRAQVFECQACDVNVVTYNGLMDSLADASEWSIALQLLQEMSSEPKRLCRCRISGARRQRPSQVSHNVVFWLEFSRILMDFKGFEWSFSEIIEGDET